MKRSRSENTTNCCYNNSYESSNNIYKYRDMNPSERKKLKSFDNLKTVFIMDDDGFEYKEWENGTIRETWISYDYPFPIIFPVR